MNKKEQTNKIKVAIIEPIGGHGGMDIYLFNLCRILAQSDCIPLIFTSDETNVPNDLTEYFILNYKGIYGKVNKYIRGIRYIYATLNTVKISLNNNIKIIHFNLFHFSLRELFTIAILKVVRRKIAATIHDVEPFDRYGISFKLSKIRYNLFYRLIDLPVFHNTYSKNEYYNKLEDCFVDKGIIISSALDAKIDKKELFEKITKNEARNKINLIKHKYIVLFFGQIKKVKGLDVLIEAFGEVIKTNNSIGLVIAGKLWKDEIDIYQELIVRYKLDNYVEKRIHYIPTEDVPYYFRAADLVVLPYKKIYNSGVFVRAASYSRPVLCSNLDIFKESINDTVNGWLFEDRNVKDLTEKILNIFKKPEDLDTIGMNMSNKLFGQQSLNDIGSTLKTAYKNQIDS